MNMMDPYSQYNLKKKKKICYSCGEGDLNYGFPCKWDMVMLLS